MSGYAWTGDDYPWMSGVWFDGLARHEYPVRIFLLDAGYGGHQKN
jgi:hypothetical protein